MHKFFAGAFLAALSQSIPRIQALRRARLFCLALFMVCLGGVGVWIWRGNLQDEKKAPLQGSAQAAEAPAPAILPAPTLEATFVPTRTFLLQAGTPAGIPNFLQPGQGCAWAGIGGQVFDLAGEPVSGMMVKVSGVYQGQTLSKVAVTNSSQGFGPGGYDLYLGSQPQATRTLTLQLVDVTGAARSQSYRLITYADCQHNLLVVNLRERIIVGRWYFPLVRQRY